MQLVDFMVTTPGGDCLLIEVGDPSATAVRPDELVRMQASDYMTNQVCSELVPKCRSSWVILYLLGKEPPTARFVAVVGAEKLNLDPRRVLTLNELLKKRLKQEWDEPWQRPYVHSGVLLTTEMWNEEFPEYPLRRVSPGGQA
jgi:hypothetical protein